MFLFSNVHSGVLELLRSSTSLSSQHQPVPAVASACPCSTYVEQELPSAEFGKEYSFGHPSVVHARNMADPPEMLM